MARAIRRVVNAAPDANFQADSASSVEAKLEFAKRLSKAIADKGMTQSELARRAGDYLVGGRKLGRDSISHYINGVSFPSQARVNAMAKALGMEPTDLLPTKGVHTAADTAAPVVMQETGDGRMYLRINKTVDYTIGLKILGLLKEDEAKV